MRLVQNGLGSQVCLSVRMQSKLGHTTLFMSQVILIVYEKGNQGNQVLHNFLGFMPYPRREFVYWLVHNKGSLVCEN